ncbi:hypothetical protein OHA72_31640 [Dactylosporangium sp. NBC_01737]|uniref:hypothetical protein n=1 Tax=Dactylosporangium sp. NBC_01737 TaxID=2975959 RepID=UPI002E118060|nr:hypothetical protein OHA72_31640 [Dactylosporangium sp. NBC_01737]
MDLALLVGGAGEEQDPLGGGGLAGVDVGEDADVAGLGQVMGAHGLRPFSVVSEQGSAIAPRRSRRRCGVVT